MGLKEEPTEYERGYLEGERRTCLSMLREIRGRLGIDEGRALSWEIERQETIAALRGLCSEFGDLEWDDNLYLPDILTKHLGDHLKEARQD